ncbi:MAG: hypothetical protein R3F17_07910 [Planctomycetota bacterium]
MEVKERILIAAVLLTNLSVAHWLMDWGELLRIALPEPTPVMAAEPESIPAMTLIPATPVQPRP